VAEKRQDPAIEGGSSEEVRKAVIQGLTAALVEVTRSKRELLSTAMEQSGQDWRAAATAMSRWESAKRTGQVAAMIEATTDILKMPFEQMPVDNDLIQTITTKVTDRNPGMSQDNPEFRRQVWQEFALSVSSPATTPNTWGTYHALLNAYPLDDAFFQDMDPVALANMRKIQEHVQIQSEGVELARDLRDQVLQFQRDVQGKTPGQIQTMLANYPVLGDDAAMQAVEKFALSQSRTHSKLEGSTQEEFDRLIALSNKIEERLFAVQGGAANVKPAESERDRIARIVAQPKFQWWAARNGLKVGTVDPNGKGGGAGVVTPVGVYKEGPDDEEALRFASEQSQRRPDQDLPWQHQRYQGEAASFGRVMVKGEEVPDTSKAVEGLYYAKKGADGSTAYLDAPGVAAALEEGRKAVVRQRAVATWRERNPGKTPTEKDLEDIYRVSEYVSSKFPADYPRDELLKAVGVEVSETPPKTFKPQEVTGKVLAPRVQDPMGSVRMLTAEGTKLYLPEQIIEDVKVTSGGGPRQTVSRFGEIARGRRAANKQVEREGQPPRQLADRAAEILVKDRFTAPPTAPAPLLPPTPPPAPVLAKPPSDEEEKAPALTTPVVPGASTPAVSQRKFTRLRRKGP
jgi:hypothetical protein